ncbi:hypothetical protein BDQ12DRAFT_395862 [Crucibulum laeve]|uniref:SH3 domain-containing protein n=1 Tax=Crucibulum laeve TaxID=68775 RepID=A0A5C3M8M4_9AGAR|nr:hypothetical protein BDQ12DRAFT_395862 [Crucibulum laeve]
MMSSSHLKVDTTVDMIAGPSSGRLPSVAKRSDSSFYKPVAEPSDMAGRGRSTSDASTSSFISPNSVPTTGSATPLNLLEKSHGYTRSRSVSPLDETVRLDLDHVLAMHDYAPEGQNATRLSFRSGQVIHVLNQDGSGWWDGELDGRRGWFPSNYVSSLVPSSLAEGEPPKSHSTLGSDIDSSCPPIMIPLRDGISLLQNAVRSNRISHFQPSTAVVISSVRSILAHTGTLQRDAPILQRFTALVVERRRILTMLSSLVAQARKASDESLEEENLKLEIESMMRLGGQFFPLVRRFLAIAAQCGVELPDESEIGESGGGPSDDRRKSQDEVGGAYSPSEQASVLSADSSQDSTPPFPYGPTTSAGVMEALRFTHDHLLSTVAAFIGHVHSHSRSSHASSTGRLYDLAREIVETVCKLLTIVEALIQHPDVATHQLGNLKAAKDDLYDVTTSLVESVRILSHSLPSTMSEEEERQALLRSATKALKSGADCVAAFKVCLSKSIGEHPFVIQLPNGNGVDDGFQSLILNKFPEEEDKHGEQQQQEEEGRTDALTDWFLDQPVAHAPEVSQRVLSIQADDETSSTSSNYSIRAKNVPDDDFFDFHTDIEIMPPPPAATKSVPDAKHTPATTQNTQRRKEKALTNKGRDRSCSGVDLNVVGVDFHEQFVSAGRNQIREFVLPDDEYSSTSESEDSQLRVRRGETRSKRRSAKERRTLDGTKIVGNPRKIRFWCF